MASGIIMIYASVDGQTKKICDHIRECLKSEEKKVEIISVKKLNELEGIFSAFEKIIIASSIRYGKHNKQIEQFIKENTDLLNAKKTAFISVNLVARKKEKSTPETNPYVIKFFNSITWKPSISAVFAGKLDYKRYTFWDSLLIKIIMMITKGPTDSNTAIEYTDWKEVTKFAEKIARL